MQRYTSKKFIALAVISILVSITGFLLFSYAYVEINVNTTSTGQKINYVIKNVDDKNSKPVEITSATTNSKRLLKRGSYEISVRQSDNSYLTVLESGGFLQTQKIDATLAPEKERTFIGNNPNICMYTVFKVLASSPCGASVNELGIHIPATSSSPTYVKHAQGPAAFLETLVSTNKGALALVRAESEIDGEGNYHALYTVNADGIFDQSSEQKLPDLNGNLVYTLVPYLKGFIAYSAGTPELLYYSSFNDTPTKLNIPKPDDSSLELLDVRVYGESIALTYSNQPLLASSHSHTEESGSHSAEVEEIGTNEKPITRVTLYSNDESRHYTFSDHIVAAIPCNNQKLCVVSKNTTLSVYSTGSKQQLLYKLTDVLDVAHTRNGFMVIKTDGVYNFDIERKSGHMDYSFGNTFSYCGIQDEAASYVVCIADESKVRFALRINNESKNVSSIDKKIAQLSKLDKVRNISIYSNIIYISPETGELQLNSQTDRFGYDPATIKTANDRINQEIDTLGIDRKAYSIVFAIR